MSAVVICRLSLVNDSIRQLLFETARLSRPYSGAELLFAGDEMPGTDKSCRTTLAIRFSRMGEAQAFLDKIREAGLAGQSATEAEFQLLKPWPPTIGQLPLMVFP